MISMWLGGNCLESHRLCPANVMHVSQVISMWLEGNCHEFRKAVPRKWSRLGAAAKVAGTVMSPMPGKIIQVTFRQSRCQSLMLPLLQASAAAEPVHVQQREPCRHRQHCRAALEHGLQLSARPVWCDNVLPVGPTYTQIF